MGRGDQGSVSYSDPNEFDRSGSLGESSGKTILGKNRTATKFSKNIF